MRLPIFICCLSFMLLQAQQEYPQDYFETPLAIPVVLAGTFGELRANHFHAGLDIKTQGRTGLTVRSAASGFVSRIEVSPYGYGRALYITHPNGYTTVYAHLKKFAPAIADYVKKEQYAQESYRVSLFPKAGLLSVDKGAKIATSGNSGSSQGPHLHFEIRDKEQRPLNPMLFGINALDTAPPFVTGIYAYPIGDQAHINHQTGVQKLRLRPLKKGQYTVDQISAYGKIGFGIIVQDRQDSAPNKNGIYAIQTTLNAQPYYAMKFDRFAFHETRALNKLIDYPFYKKEKERIMKLFDDNIPLSFIKPGETAGYLTLKDSTNVVFKIAIQDFQNNTTTVTLNLEGQRDDTLEKQTEIRSPYFIKSYETTHLKVDDIKVTIDKNTFFDNSYLDVSAQNDTLTLHRDVIPLRKKIQITYPIDKYQGRDKDKLYIGKLVPKSNFISYLPTQRTAHTISAKTQTLGRFALGLDTIAPRIKPLNFKNKSWLSRATHLSLKIKDTPSGISNYRATVNGQWILMAYDYKTQTLRYDFEDGVVSDRENNLKLIVTDNVGNSATFEAVFFRK